MILCFACNRKYVNLYINLRFPECLFCYHVELQKIASLSLVLVLETSRPPCSYIMIMLFAVYINVILNRYNAYFRYPVLV